jgi:hypothetical protein
MGSEILSNNSRDQDKNLKCKWILKKSVNIHDIKSFEQSPYKSGSSIGIIVTMTQLSRAALKFASQSPFVFFIDRSMLINNDDAYLNKRVFTRSHDQ